MGLKAGTRVCIYCGQEKPHSEFSLEHIFPSALGGKLAPTLFKTREACERCNNIHGLFVDAAFIKGFLHQAGAALAQADYVDPRLPDSTTDLMYFGHLGGLDVPVGEVCEMWVGPCGIHFYHIHKADDPRWDSYVGGDPTRGRDPGRVYVRFTTAQSDWVGLALRSAARFFPNARRYAPGVEFRAEPGTVPFLHDMDDTAREEAARIVALPDEKNMRVTINPGFDVRFMAKMALGLGHNILGAEFLTTDYAFRLRGLSREKNPEKHADFRVHGSSVLESRDDKMAAFMAWRGAYTIFILAAGDRLGLGLYLPSGQGSYIAIADEERLWQGEQFHAYREGVIFLVLPQIGRFTTALPLPTYIAHRTSTNRSPILAEIEAMRVDQTSLPPCR